MIVTQTSEFFCVKIKGRTTRVRPKKGWVETIFFILSSLQLQRKTMLRGQIPQKPELPPKKQWSRMLQVHMRLKAQKE